MNLMATLILLIKGAVFQTKKLLIFIDINSFPIFKFVVYFCSRDFAEEKNNAQLCTCD